MKQLRLLPLFILLFTACKKECPIEKNSELCFSVKGENITVTNKTKTIIYYDMISSSYASRVDRIPFDCLKWNSLASGKSKTYPLNNFFKEEFSNKTETTLSLTWWKCDGDKIVGLDHYLLDFSKEDSFCKRVE